MKRYLVTGLLIWIPLAITLWVLHLLVTTMDGSLDLLPPRLQPEALIGTRIPGLGVILTILVVLLTGVLASNIFGQRIVQLWESLLRRIPVVNTIYHGVKQVSDTLFKPGGQAFRKALLVEWPREGTWTIAFLTGTPGGDVATHLAGDYVSVYVPTTPNPTGGYFVMLPRADVIELDMTVDEALEYIISMGVAPPRGTRKAARSAGPSALERPHGPAADVERHAGGS
ncbi:MAG: DUF502 domain-containing protein [Burkholderiales bacterium]|nr:DUF502 domain-containing protein [Burkholderiales bacterium]